MGIPSPTYPRNAYRFTWKGNYGPTITMTLGEKDYGEWKKKYVHIDIWADDLHKAKEKFADHFVIRKLKDEEY